MSLQIKQANLIMIEKKIRQPAFNGAGILLVDKPTEWTSHDIVGFVRGRFNIDKVGHCGTLDPAATGLMVIVIGKFTKLSQHLSGDDKTYEATLLAGTETDSMDMDGTVTSQNDWGNVTEKQVKNSFKSFIGKQKQLPPMVSAKKIGGKRLYELARKGKEIERDPVDIIIHSLEVTRIRLPYVDFKVTCSKGTYIRALCYDIGKKLGCGGTLFCLRRTKSGIFDVKHSVTVEQIRDWTQEDLNKNLLDMSHNRFQPENLIQGNRQNRIDC